MFFWRVVFARRFKIFLMKTQKNNSTLILFAVLGIAGLYYLFSKKSEKKDNTYQVAIPSNETFATVSSYSDILANKMKRTKELTDAGVDPLTLLIY